MNVRDESRTLQSTEFLYKFLGLRWNSTNPYRQFPISTNGAQKYGSA